MEPLSPEESMFDSEKAEKKKKKAGKKLLTMERVRLALERLQLAWVNFAITLTVFGFTIDRVLESKFVEGRRPILGFVTGREIGMFLLLLGITGLLVATIQHRQSIERLKQYYKEKPHSVSLWFAYIILTFSSIMFLVIMTRL